MQEKKDREERQECFTDHLVSPKVGMNQELSFIFAAGRR